VSAVVNSDDMVFSDNQKPGTIEIREGDWKAYLYYIKKCRDNKNIQEHYDSVIAYKRACAMAYLGKRAQYNGGVCSITRPHIITPQFIANLEASNKAQRYSRYPWLEALMNVLAEIERIQDEISISSNIFSLMPNSK
jgi:hypothetical protein